MRMRVIEEALEGSWKHGSDVILFQLKTVL